MGTKQLSIAGGHLLRVWIVIVSHPSLYCLARGKYFPLLGIRLMCAFSRGYVHISSLVGTLVNIYNVYEQLGLIISSGVTWDTHVVVPPFTARSH